MLGLKNVRALGLNTTIRSVVDLKAVADLSRVNGDLGRVAGLLKLWLLEKNGQGTSSVEVERMMFEFRELQAGVREKNECCRFCWKVSGMTSGALWIVQLVYVSVRAAR